MVPRKEDDNMETEDATTTTTSTTAADQDNMNDTNENDNDDSDDEDTEEEEEQSEQVRVTFQLATEYKNNNSNNILKVPTEPIAVPADIGRKGLQAVINHLLDRKVSNDNDKDDNDDHDDDERLPALTFDFIVGSQQLQQQQLQKSSTTVIPTLSTNTTSATTTSTINTKQRLLRTGIEREARRNGLSLEHSIPVIYFPSQSIPQQQDDSEQLPDWIGSLCYNSTNNNSILVAGCYDGTIHIMKEDGGTTSTTISATNTIQAHTGPIKSVCTFTKTYPTTTTEQTNDNDMEKSSIWIASGSIDHTLVIHQYNTHTNEIQKHTECYNGHNSAISCIDIANCSTTSSYGKIVVTNDGQQQQQQSKTLMASTDWDGGLCIWDLSLKNNDGTDDNDDEEDVQLAKKTKRSSSTTKANDDNKHQSIIQKLSPIISIQAHVSNVSGVSWGNWNKRLLVPLSQQQQPTTIITGSWDHSIKVWDVLNQDCILTLNGSRVITCLDTSYYTANVVATGHPDCTIRLWDTRVSINNNNNSTTTTQQQQQHTVSDNTLRPSHKAYVTSVQWSKSNPYQLSSTSHDGTIKLWDIRSSIPLHTVKVYKNNNNSSNNKISGTQKQPHKCMALAYSDGSITNNSTDGVVDNTSLGSATNGMIFVGGTDCKVHRYSLAF